MKRILLAPLDWGLGHATRCIPIIRELQFRGCEVLLAGSGDSLELLRKEFPGLKYFSLPGYDPRYPLHGSMVLAMARQLPGFMKVIASEHRELEQIVNREKIDAVISDNRYGCWSQQVPCALLTHQSNILMPQKFGFLQGFVRRAVESRINRFHMCWIPDFPEGHSLAGDLISFGKIRITSHVRYIGWLSRFVKSEGNHTEKYDLLAVISGPEPQRSSFEKLVASQLRSSGLKFKIVRGLPAASGTLPDGVNFLASEEMQQHIESSALILARSGYSTIMDMNALGKKAIFVPTPGQTEQEYLANRLMKKGIAYAMPQDQFNLMTAITESKKYTGFRPADKNSLLAGAIDELLSMKL